MRIVIAVLGAVLGLSAPAFAGGKEVFCPPGKATCDVPTVDIQGTVQADRNNSNTTDQNADINMQGTVQAGRNNSSNVRQNGRVNNSSTVQGQR